MRSGAAPKYLNRAQPALGVPLRRAVPVAAELFAHALQLYGRAGDAGGGVVDERVGPSHEGLFVQPDGGVVKDPVAGEVVGRDGADGVHEGVKGVPVPGAKIT